VAEEAFCLKSATDPITDLLHNSVKEKRNTCCAMFADSVYNVYSRTINVVIVIIDAM